MTVFLCVDSNGSSDVPTGNGVRRIEDDEAKPGLRGTADVTVRTTQARRQAYPASVCGHEMNEWSSNTAPL